MGWGVESELQEMATFIVWLKEQFMYTGSACTQQPNSCEKQCLPDWAGVCMSEYHLPW